MSYRFSGMRARVIVNPLEVVYSKWLVTNREIFTIGMEWGESSP
jgi:hypothetical protein